MNDADKGPRRMTRTQMVRLAAIPVLGFVLYQQTVGRLDAVQEPPQTTTSVVSPEELPNPTKTPAEAAPVRILENVRDLESIARENPFAVPEALQPAPAETSAAEESGVTEVAEPTEDAVQKVPSAAEAQWQQAAARWEAKRVRIVFRAGSDLMAVVGDQTVRVGDVLEEGVRVAEIRPDGVVLEEMRPADDD